MVVKTYKTCRFCNFDLTEAVNLGKHYLHGSFIFKDYEPPTEKVPVRLMFCESCKLVQLGESVDADTLYDKYGYRSSINEKMKDHLKGIAEELIYEFPFTKSVLDIACIPPNHFVNTNKGLKKTEEIKNGDYVVNHLGTYSKVVKTFNRLYSGNIHTFKFRCHNTEMTVTEEHPLLTINGWKKASQISVGERIWSVTSYNFVKFDEVDLYEILIKCHKFKVNIDGDFIISDTNGLKNKIPRFLKLDSDFYKVLGYFIGEGSTIGSAGLAFAFNIKEKEKVEHIKKYFKEYFDLSSNIYTRGNAICIRVFSRLLASVFSFWCGRHAANKQIPDILKLDETIYSFLNAIWFTDGHINVNSDYIYSSVSKKLVLQLYNLLLFLGIKCSVSKVKNNRGFSKKGGYLYRLSIFAGKNSNKFKEILDKKLFLHGERLFNLLQVTDITTSHYNGPVYNLEVKDTNSFTCDGIIVHNCNDMYLLSCYSDSIKKVGIDPCDAGVNTDIKLKNHTFINKCYPCKELKDEKFDLITIIAMFYDLNNPLEVVKELKKNLSKEGVLVVEVSYWPEKMQKNAVDELVMEHVCYYSFKTITDVFENAGLDVFRVKRNDINGGSIQLWFCHREDLKNKKNNIWNKEILELINLEKEEKVNSLDQLLEFKNRIEANKEVIRGLIGQINSHGESIFLYGASTKSNVFLQFIEVNNSQIPYAAERNEEKWGGRTLGTNIEMISEDEARRKRPDYFLCLIWGFKEQVLRREKDYIMGGGKIIFPIPELLIVDRNNYYNHI